MVKCQTKDLKSYQLVVSLRVGQSISRIKDIGCTELWKLAYGINIESYGSI